MENGILRPFRDLLTVPGADASRTLPSDAARLPTKDFWRDALKRPLSLNENEAQLEGVILLIRYWPLSAFPPLIFRHKSELIAHPQIHISRDPIHFISALISRRVEPVGYDTHMCEIVYHRHGGFGIRAEAGESASGRDVVPSALNATEQRQPFLDRIARVKRDAVQIVSDRPFRLNCPVRVQ